MGESSLARTKGIAGLWNAEVGTGELEDKGSREDPSLTLRAMGGLV
jgi:hypothetical protein